MEEKHKFTIGIEGISNYRCRIQRFGFSFLKLLTVSQSLLHEKLKNKKCTESVVEMETGVCEKYKTS